MPRSRKDAYPEHEKLSKISDKSQTCYNFIEFLREKDVVFAKWHEHDDDCRGDSGSRICGMTTNQPITGYLNWSKLLAEFFEINQEKIDAEKEQMLQELRNANKSRQA